MIYVENKYRYKRAGESIMRGTPLGNIFKIGPDGSREMVVDKYRKWFDKKVKDNDPIVMAELQRLLDIARVGDLHLLCVCKPWACHGDIIKAYLDGLVENQ